MKKKLLILLSIVVLALAACGKKNDDKQESTSKKGGNERIASLSIHLTNDLLALGITPAGSVVGGSLNTFLPHVQDQLKNTKPLGSAKDPDMETLLSLKPSAIYADKEFSGTDTSKYEKIAPTHVFDLDKGTWRDHLKKIAKTVNREKEAKTFISDYEKERKEVKALIEQELGKNSKAMAIRVTGKELRVFSKNRPMGPILFDDLGFTPANGVEKLKTNRPYEVISQEVLPDYDADAIFVIVNSDDEAKTAFKQLEASPIWKGLKPVKENHVYVVSDQPWLDYSALGNKMALDQAKKMFSK